MKAFFIISLFVVLLQGCSNSVSTDEASKDSTNKSSNEASTSKNNGQQEYLGPEFGNLISGKETYDYVENYRRYYIKDSTDTRAVWFGKGFFKYIDSSLKTDPHADGVRIYLGAYTEKDYPEIPHRLNQISLFWVATKDSGKWHHDDTSFFQYPMPLTLNHGELCPPNAGCAFCGAECLDPNWKQKKTL